MIKVDAPQLKVYIYKTGARKRNVTKNRWGTFNTLNLTGFFTDGSSVTVNRSINNPNGGFTIKMADQFVPKYGDSIYGLIEPMDAVEISMSRVGEPAMVMRGVVNDIVLDEAIGQGPTRTVTISGGDYGAFLRMIQIMVVKGSDVDDLIYKISGQYMQDKYGINYSIMTGGKFISAMTNMVVNPFVKGLLNPVLSDLKLDTDGADETDFVYPNGYQANPEGTMWTHILTHGNLGPFYEMFFEDNENATTLVYRKPAFKLLAGDKYIFPNTKAKSFDIPPVEITGIKYSRTDRNVANYFLVRSPKADMITGMDASAQSYMTDGTKLVLDTYENCAKDLFGRRQMLHTTNHGPMYGAVTLRPGLPKEEHETAVNYFTAYMIKQIEFLKASNKDNAVFESGTLRCAGRPEYKVGHYCNIAWPSGVNASAYITSVAHTFEPFKGYTCTLQYERGTGFVNRTNAENPYLRGQGVYQ